MTDESPSEEEGEGQNPESAIYGEQTGFRGRTTDEDSKLRQTGSEMGPAGEAPDVDQPSDPDASPGYVPSDETP